MCRRWFKCIRINSNFRLYFSFFYFTNLAYTHINTRAHTFNPPIPLFFIHNSLLCITNVFVSAKECSAQRRENWEVARKAKKRKQIGRSLLIFKKIQNHAKGLATQLGLLLPAVNTPIHHWRHYSSSIATTVQQCKPFEKHISHWGGLRFFLATFQGFLNCEQNKASR